MAVEPRSASMISSLPALVAGSITAAVTVLYVAIIASQGNFSTGRGRVIFVTAFLVVTFAAAVGGALIGDPAVRLMCLGAATGSLFSIGLPMLVAGVLGAWAWARTSAPSLPRRARRLAAAFALAAPVVLVAGIALT